MIENALMRRATRVIKYRKKMTISEPKFINLHITKFIRPYKNGR